MKVSILQENLARAINIANRLISQKAQLPVLQNILFSARSGKLTLSATNLETGITIEVGAKVEEEGDTTIPGKIAVEFINNLPQDKASLVSDEKTLKIDCAGYRATINSMPASDFPPPVRLKNKPQLVWQGDVFSLASGQVVFAAAQDENRPTLNGILVVLKDSKLRLVATDGYRLSLKELETEPTKNKEGTKFLVPSRAFLEAGKIAAEKEVGEKEKKEEVGISLLPEGNQVVFSWEDIELSTRLIDGQFPDYEKIIPKDFNTKAIFDKNETLRAVKSAAVFARDSANIIRLKIGKSGMEISANTAQIGENTIAVSAEVSGEENEIAFNSRFLLDFLNCVTSERIIMKSSGNLAPGVFQQEKDSSFLHLIMPVRVQA